MEKYLSLIILAAPGFIAERIANILGVMSSKKGEFDSLAGYLSYSFFSVLLAIIISALTGMVDLSENWQDFTEKFSSVDFTIKMLITTLFSAAIVGVPCHDVQVVAAGIFVAVALVASTGRVFPFGLRR